MTTTGTCLTCYGSGETITERGPTICPDCLDGELSATTRIEWWLREIEGIYRGSGREAESEVLWLVQQLRQSRTALLRILAACQDADESDAMARELKFVANEALEVYAPKAI